MRLPRTGRRTLRSRAPEAWLASQPTPKPSTADVAARKGDLLPRAHRAVRRSHALLEPPSARKCRARLCRYYTRRAEPSCPSGARARARLPTARPAQQASPAPLALLLIREPWIHSAQ